MSLPCDTNDEGDGGDEPEDDEPAEVMQFERVEKDRNAGCAQCGHDASSQVP